MKRLILLALLLIVGCSQSPSPGEAFRLTYNPPDSVDFNVEVVSTTQRIRGADTSVDSSWSMTSHTLVADGSGYKIYSATDTTWFSQNGERLNSPIVALFAAGKFTHLIDSTGKALDVQGYEALFEQLDTLLDPDTATMLRQNVNPAMLKEREMRDWNSRLNRFADQDLYVGQPIYDTIPVTLPTGAMLRGYEVRELVDTVRLDTTLCARILVASHTDPRKLAEMIGKPADEVVDAFLVTETTLAGLDTTMIASQNRSEWLVEVNTMLSRSYDQSRELQLFGPGGVTLQGRLVDSQHKKYSYE